jgi:ornithine cyclodeaminase/alanine dehydrogenase-like protein (mu-crystallin family)
LEILIVNQSEVPQLLPMSDCIEVMAEALKALARGSAILPLRPTLWLPDKTGALVVMPAYLGDTDLLGLIGTESDNIFRRQSGDCAGYAPGGRNGL